MEAVIFIGLQASGKSTFYKHRFFKTHVRVNRDMLHTKHREHTLVDACIGMQQRFVSDNTNVTREIRARTIQPAKAAGYLITGYFFEVDLNASIKRNAERPEDEIIPIVGIRDMYNRLEPPTFEEGFAKLYTVRIAEYGSFFVDDWQPED